MIDSQGLFARSLSEAPANDDAIKERHGNAICKRHILGERGKLAETEALEWIQFDERASATFYYQTPTVGAQRLPHPVWLHLGKAHQILAPRLGHVLSPTGACPTGSPMPKFGDRRPRRLEGTMESLYPPK
ncbi:MAG: hypothetical protein GY696_14695 [Gammaproteobacteria bacterium]|nr:hypothetical protein [Gammaproteobacteria bacterium]